MYSEKVINSQLHYSLDNVTWHRYTYEQLTTLYTELKRVALCEAGSNAVLDDVDRESTTCVVGWCGNKCDLYQKDMYGKKTYTVIQSLEENGHCPYRINSAYVI